MRGPLIERTLTSLTVLAAGYSIGLTLAILFTTIAVSTRIGTDLLSTLTAMFNPLPAIALLPLALLWFGLGAKSLIFVIVHSVLWAVALNTHSGFTSVSHDACAWPDRIAGCAAFLMWRSSWCPRRFPRSSPA